MLTDEQIFDILDGCAEAEVLQQHVHLLANSLAYQQYFKELEAIHIDLAGMPIEHTSANFTESVLTAVHAGKPEVLLVKKKAWSSKLPYVFFGTMAAMFVIAIGIAIFYQPTSVTVEQQPDVMLKEINNFLVQHFTQGAILLNLIVMLVLFDRKVLRPYFSHRRITLN